MKFRVTFEVDWEQLAELSSATGDNFHPVSVEPVKDQHNGAKKKNPPKRTPAHLTDGGKAILELMAGSGRSWRIADFHAEFNRLGYSPKSAGTIVASLARDGKVERLEPGVYAEVAEHAAAA
jgi:hypothetical protein